MQEEYDQGKTLPILETFYSIQGEGFHTGKAACFIRLGGCDIGCSWCDSKNAWKQGIYPLVTVDEILKSIEGNPAQSVVVTGGEPMQYNLDILSSKLREKGFETFLETSGSYTPTGVWDWVCFSPKSHSKQHPEYYQMANELKIIVEDPSDLEWAEQNAQKVNPDCTLFLQPEWSKRDETNEIVTAYIRLNPKWRMSLQVHKFIGIR